MNECSNSAGRVCSPLNSKCVNTPGSFHCNCKEGFESVTRGRACQGIIDINYSIDNGFSVKP